MDLQTIDGGLEQVPEGHHVFVVTGECGDTKHIWDKTKRDEVEAAKDLYKSLTKKGYRAFHVVGKDGAQGEQMREFDSEAERVIFIPQMAGG